MLKLTLMIMLFTTSSYIGFMYGETFRKRLIELKETLKALLILQNDVVYGTMPLPEALENLCYKVDDPLKKLIKAIDDRLIEGNVESVYEGFKEEYAKLENEFYIDDSDRKVVGDFFKSLGETGVYGQEKVFELAIEGIKLNLKDADERAKKNIKLYRYLGVCLGAMLTIFFI